MKRLICAILSVVVIVSLISTLTHTEVYGAEYVESNMRVIIDGRELKFTKAPIVHQGSTLIAALEVFNAFNNDGTGTIDWDRVNKSATITIGRNKLQFWIGKNTALVNGSEVAIYRGVTPFIYKDSTYLPLAFFAEALGYVTAYDGSSKTAILKKAEDYDKTKDIVSAINEANGGIGAYTMDLKLNQSIVIQDELLGIPPQMFSFEGYIEKSIDKKYTQIIADTDGVYTHLYDNGKYTYISDDIEGWGRVPTVLDKWLGFAANAYRYFTVPSSDDDVDKLLYAGIDYTNDANGDLVLSGTVYASAKMPELIMAGFSEIDYSFDINKYHVTYVVDSTSYKLKSFMLTVDTDSLLQTNGVSIPVGIDYALVIENIDSNPSFSTEIPSEVITTAIVMDNI